MSKDRKWCSACSSFWSPTLKVDYGFPLTDLWFCNVKCQKKFEEGMKNYGRQHLHEALSNLQTEVLKDLEFAKKLDALIAQKEKPPVD